MLYSEKDEERNYLVISFLKVRKVRIKMHREIKTAEYTIRFICGKTEVFIQVLKENEHIGNVIVIKPVADLIIGAAAVEYLPSSHSISFDNLSLKLDPANIDRLTIAEWDVQILKRKTDINILAHVIIGGEYLALDNMFPVNVIMINEITDPEIKAARFISIETSNNFKSWKSQHGYISGSDRISFENAVACKYIRFKYFNGSALFNWPIERHQIRFIGWSI